MIKEPTPKKKKTGTTYRNLMLAYAAANKLTVVDADKPTTVTVTADHIVRAKKRDSLNCAFAEACKASPEINTSMAFFTRGVAYVRRGQKIVRYLLGEKATREIVSFDRSKIMAPDTYTLKAPKPSQRKGYKKPTGPRKTKGRPARVSSAMVRTADDVSLKKLIAQ